METYGRILLIAMPVFLVLVLFEKWYGWVKGRDTVRTIDMVSSLASGVTNVTKDVLGLSIAILSYGWMVKHLAIVHIQHGFFTYLIAFLVLDFAGYWTHRFAHEYNFFWNNHIIHHSSEEFNLACALRQSISGIVKIFVVLLLPAALLGVPEKVIAIVAPLHLFAQFWYHTQHISKMGIFEKLIVTPSHHRVHHAINKEYLDKNYGQIFIFWDKWFGSFQAELDTVKPVYGITRPAATWNPIRINFQHLWLLIKDAWRTKNYKDKWRIWLMPTGWRPADVVAKYPVKKIDDVYHFEKYNPVASTELKTWIVFQLLILLCFISYFFGNIANIGSPDMFVYGMFVFLYVYAFMELADRNPYSLVWEILKGGLGIGIVLHWGKWFGLNMLWSNTLLIGYFIVSIIITAWFVYKHMKEHANSAVSA